LACAGRCHGGTRVDDHCLQLCSAGGAEVRVRRQRDAAGGAAALEWRPAARAEASAPGVLVTANQAVHEDYRITSRRDSSQPVLPWRQRAVSFGLSGVAATLRMPVSAARLGPNRYRSRRGASRTEFGAPLP